MMIVGLAISNNLRIRRYEHSESLYVSDSPEKHAVHRDDSNGLPAVDYERYWPQWRGPLGTGVAPYADPPVVWSETRNIRWKVPLPGEGHSTPAVWNDRVFITAAIPYGDSLEPRYSGAPGGHDEVPITRSHEFTVMTIDRRDGKILWRRTVRRELPHEGGHVTASLASASPVTDGEHLFAFFGSRGLYALNLDGDLLWEADFGRMHTLHGHGEGSSPALYRDTLIINWDHEGQSFVVALHKRTGKERWKVKRDAMSSWSAPIIVDSGGTPQVIISGSKRLRGYDLATGKVIWECGGLSVENVVVTPVAGDGMVYAGSSYDRRIMLGVHFDGASGDITGTNRVVWSRRKGPPYVPSPLLYEDALYYHSHFGNVLTRVEAATGEDRPGQFRLNGIGNVFASPVAAAGRVYISDREGNTLVFTHSKTPEFLALNTLNDGFSASASLAGRDLFLRGQRNLYCIVEE